MRLALKDPPFLAKVEGGLIFLKLFYFMDVCKGFIEPKNVKNIYQKLANTLTDTSDQ